MMTRKEKHIRRFAKAGFRVIPLNGKVPSLGWPKTEFTPKPDLSKFPGNYGLALDADVIVIDVDPRAYKDGVDSFKKLCTDLMIPLDKIARCKQRTGGGGLHLFFKNPTKTLVKNHLPEYPGVEFKSIGRQVVGPGSIHPDSKKEYKLLKDSDPKKETLSTFPEELLEMIKRDTRLVFEKGIEDYDDSDGNIETVIGLLARHPEAIEGAGGDLTTYQAACIGRDQGISPHMNLELLEEYYNQRCQPPWSSRELHVKVRNAYRYAQNAVGARNPKADFEVIESEKAEQRQPKEVVAQPDFLDEIKDNWCYSIKTKEFFKLSTMSSYDKEMFDDLHAGKTDKKKPSAFAIQHPDMPKVETPTYWPGEARFIEEDGAERINLYDAPKITARAGDIKPWLEFVDFVVGPDKAWIVNDFVAHLLQNPGDKMLWAVLIQGKPGVGKSLLANTVAGLLGSGNVSQPTNAQVHEKYTDWLKSCQLVIVHELMAAGRLEMMNKLKDPITEPIINVRQMFKPAYQIKNRANFLFLTNYEDSIILPKDDRRFCVIFSEAQQREHEYYEELVAWIKTNRGVLYDYYKNQHVKDSRFKPKAHAPMTPEKMRMIQTTMHPIESFLHDLREDRVPPMHGKITDIASVMDKVRPVHRNINYHTLAAHMKNCGYTPLGDRVRLSCGRRTKLWALSNAEMFEKLSLEKVVSLYEKQQEEYEASAEDDVLRDFG